MYVCLYACMRVFMHVLNTHLYTARVKWFPDKTLVLQIQNREQTQLELLQVSPDHCVCLYARVEGVVRVLIVPLHICMHVSIYLSIYLSMHVYVCIHVDMYTCMYVLSVHVCIYVCFCISTHRMHMCVYVS